MCKCRRFMTLTCFALMMSLILSLAPATVFAKGWSKTKVTSSIDKNMGGMTEEEQLMYKQLYSLKSVYPEGSRWSEAKHGSFHGGIFGGGYGSSSFVFLLSDAVFGYRPAEKLSVTTKHINNVKVGDILRIDDNTRSVIVMKVNENSFTVAEGNWYGTVHWGRKISKSHVKNTGTYIMTRYDLCTLIDKNTDGMSAKEKKVYQVLYKLKSKYPEGTVWTNETVHTFHGGLFGAGFGCSGFAFMMSDAAFGTAKATMTPVSKKALKNVKVGDIIRVSDNTHSVIVMKKTSSGIVAAEGNYFGTVHWGRILTNKYILETGTYIMSRY